MTFFPIIPSSRYLFWFDREFAVSSCFVVPTCRSFSSEEVGIYVSDGNCPLDVLSTPLTVFTLPHQTFTYTASRNIFLSLRTDHSPSATTPHHHQLSVNHVSKRQLDSQVFPLLLGHTRGYGTQRTLSRTRSTRWTSRLGRKSIISFFSISYVAEASFMIPSLDNRDSAWKKTSELV